MYATTSLDCIRGGLLLPRCSGSPFNLPSRRVFKNPCRSFHWIFRLSPGVLLPLPLAFTSELWLLLWSLLLALLIFVVKQRFRVGGTLMHALHRRGAPRSTTAFNLGTVLSHAVYLFVSPPPHRESTATIPIARRKRVRNAHGRGLCI